MGQSETISIKTRLGSFLRRKERSTYYWKVRQGANGSRNTLLRCWYWYQHRKLMQKNNADIPLSAKIHGKPAFPHGLSGIFVSAGAEIGTDCVIFQQVTIGSNTLPDSRGRGAPVIGDHVYIGCGAKIIGNVHVGNHVRIGANCVVTRDVPDNSTVVLSAPRVIPHQEPLDNTFVGFSESAGDLV